MASRCHFRCAVPKLIHSLEIGHIVLGHVSTPDSNRYTADKWVGKRVNRNGTYDYGTVLRAYWQSVGSPVKLSVDWDVQSLAVGALTDSEHVTIVKES